MQENVRSPRAEYAKTGKKRKVVTLRHPPTEDKASEGAGETAGYYGAAPGEFHVRPGRTQSSPDTHPDADRHSDAQQIPDEFRKARLGVLKHHAGLSGNGGQIKKTPNGQYPKQERGTETPS